jgi:predicted transcriptional regulator
MKKFFIILFMLSLLVASTVIAEDNHRNLKKISKSYKCKHVGIQKVKPYHFKNLRHFGYVTIKVKAKYEIKS